MPLTAADIEILPGLEPVRRRPAMFVGEPRSPGVLECVVIESVCLAADQIALGTASRATLTVGPTDVVVQDDGLGLPVDVRRDGRRVAESLVSELHACRLAKAVPEVGGGFCTAGIAITNALCAFFEMDFVRDGERWFQRYERGLELAPLANLGPSTAKGLKLRFQPDPQIFGDARIDAELLRERLAEHETDLNGRIAIIDAR
jgi:DNA gyrase subunit B